MFERSTLKVGDKLKLNSDVSVIKGTFKAGSILTVIGMPDSRGEFECSDRDSGETVYLHPALSSYSKV